MLREFPFIDFICEEEKTQRGAKSKYGNKFESGFQFDVKSSKMSILLSMAKQETWGPENSFEVLSKS